MAAPRAFRSAVAFRAWLDRHAATKPELVVRLFKNSAKAKGMGYLDALDEALSVGWIDGIRRAYDNDSFTVRFTPRKPRSIWSLVNVRKAEALVAAGRMTPAGLKAFRAREAHRTGIYAFERDPMRFSAAFERRFRAMPAARRYFLAQPAGYRKLCTHWVMSAKQEETRTRRFGTLLDHCAAGRRMR